MKKKTNIYLLIFAVIALGSFALYESSKNTKSTLKPNANFAIQNTDDISKIIITDERKNSILLEKKQDFWALNKEFKARPDAIDNIFDLCKRIKVQEEVSSASRENIIKSIIGQHKKVEFFFDGENSPSKTYFVGNATADHYGTFMLLETKNEGRSNTPHITHIPGFNGYLTARFFTDINEWKYTGVFNYNDISEIKTIQVEFNKENEESYSISLDENGKVSMKDNENKMITSFDTLACRNYVLNYKKIHFNRYDRVLAPYQVDSIKRSTPIHTISVTSDKGEMNSIKLFSKAPPKGKTDIYGKLLSMDKENYYGIINNSNELVLVQTYVFGKLLKPLSYFKK